MDDTIYLTYVRTCQHPNNTDTLFYGKWFQLENDGNIWINEQTEEEKNQQIHSSVFYSNVYQSILFHYCNIFKKKKMKWKEKKTGCYIFDWNDDWSSSIGLIHMAQNICKHFTQ